MNLKFYLTNLYVVVAIYIAGEAGLLLSIPPSNAAAVWPAAGVALAAILISNRNVIPGIIIGGILVQTSSYLDHASVEKILLSFLIGTIISTGAAIQALVGSKLVKNILKKDPALLQELSIIKFSFLAGPVSCLISATIGITTLFIQGILSVDDIPLAWSTWWIGDSIGVLVFTPILLCFFGQPRELWKQRITSVALPLCVLTIISFVLFKLSYINEMKSIENDFEQSAESIKRELGKSLLANVHATSELKRLFNLVDIDELSEEEFALTTRSILFQNEQIHALEWIPMVTRKERVDFERSIGAPIMATNKQGELTIAPDRNYHYVIKYVEPLMGNEKAYRYDIRSNPFADEATYKACSTGLISITDGIKLVQEKNNQVGLVFYEPIYKKQLSSNYIENCDDLKGFVASVFRLEEAINKIHKVIPESVISLSLYRENKLIYSDKNNLKQQHNIPTQFRFFRSYELPVANTIYQLNFEPDNGFIASYSSWLIWLIIVSGLLVSAVSGMGLLMITGRALSTEELVKLRTNELNDEIQERKLVQESLSYQASHDSLTGLMNRREFEKRAQRLLSDVKDNNTEHTLCFMDLDQFKIVNDTCGHNAGDELLRQLSAMLREKVRHNDVLARLGGDEFGILMESCHVDDAERVAEVLKNSIQEFQFLWDDNLFKVGVSIGLVSISEYVPDLTELLKQADAACYMAKDSGRNCVHVYRTEDIQTAQRHGEMQWVNRIQKALEEDQFVLFAQKINPLQGKDLSHYEILIRIKDENNKIIPPGAFLPSAERYNLIEKIDRWVINKTITTLAGATDFLNSINAVSINLSGQTLTRPDFLDFVTSEFEKAHLDGSKICFEITETSAVANLNAAKNSIKSLNELGCRFSLDDFGSGLSSFGYLKNFPVDFLKIDGMFIRDIVDDKIDYAMVKSINDIGHTMGMKTIAEFVENDKIIALLKDIEVDYIQGYGVQAPMPLEDIINSYMPKQMVL